MNDMPENNLSIEQIASEFIEESSEAIQEGRAFNDICLGFEAETYVQLIKILDKLGLESMNARIGFNNLYEYISIRSDENPVDKSLADLAEVKLWLHNNQPYHALARARSIFPTEGILVESDFLKSFASQEINTNKFKALQQVANYYATNGNLEQAESIAIELIVYGDQLRFSDVLWNVAQKYYTLGDMVSVDRIKARLIGFVEENTGSKITIKFIIERVRDTVIDIERMQAGLSIDKHYQDNENTDRLLEQLEAIDNWKELGKSDLLAILTSAQMLIDSDDLWVFYKDELFQVLETIGEKYLEELDSYIDQDGKLPSAVKEKQGNVAIIKGGDNRKPDETYYFLAKYALGITAFKFQDIEYLQRLLHEHFSMDDFVHLFQTLLHIA